MKTEENKTQKNPPNAQGGGAKGGAPTAPEGAEGAARDHLGKAAKALGTNYELHMYKGMISLCQFHLYTTW